jgi:N-acetylglucosaminyl-diphospho-decaprenol L-rhamnosyltransferase
MSGNGGSRRPSVLVITVSYKTARLVENSLRALARERTTSRCDITAYVIDNASGDAPHLAEAIAQNGWGDFAHLHASTKNGGFSFGNNRGFEHAYAGGNPPDYFLLLNPDAAVEPGAIDELVMFLEEHPRAAVAGSLLLFEDGTPWPYAFRFPTLLSELNTALSIGLVSKLLDPWIVARRMGSSPERVDWLPGASMMVRRSAVDAAGGLDEAYFLYFEELDFCEKLHRLGWETWYVPASRVMHIAGQSSGITARGRIAPLPAYWYESRRRYFEKNHGVPYAMLTDAICIPAYMVGRMKRRLLGKAKENIPRFTLELIKHSTLLHPRRELEPPIEYTKPAAPSRS